MFALRIDSCIIRLKTYKMATSILLKFVTLGWDISRTIWCIEVSESSFFAFFTLFHFKLFFDRSFPLIASSLGK